MQASILYFDRFELDLHSYELRESGRVIKLERLPTELLILLAESQGQMVTRDAIVRRLWGDNVFVDTRQGINTAVRKLRIALHDDPENPRLLQTVAGRGYRLLAPVSSPTTMTDRDAELLPSTAAAMASPAETPLASRASAFFRQWRLLLIAMASGALALSALFLARQQQIDRPTAEQRITSNPPEAPIKFAVVSPDGRYLAYADPTGLYLRQIASGETRLWALPKDFVVYPNCWFPDGTHLLVMRIEGPMRMPSLWKISMLGASPRKLNGNASLGSISPDGTKIAFLATSPAWGRELWVMGSDGSNPHKVAVASPPEQPIALSSRIFRVAWSPNSRRIAFIENHVVAIPTPADFIFSLETIDANGGDLQVILNDFRLAPALYWAPDGRILFAYRKDAEGDRGGQGVRAIRVNEITGKTIGQPQSVTEGAGRIGGISVTSDGNRLVIWRMNTQLQVFITELDPATSRWKSPRRLTMDANSNLAEAWLADSKTVLFVSNRNGTWTLFKQNINETTAEVLVEGRNTFLPRLSADGLQVFYESRPDPANTSNPISLMRLPVAGGAPQLVLQESGIINYQCARLPSTLCVLSRIQGTDHIFLAFDIKHGIGQELLRTSDGPNDWSLSPDGKKLAVFPGDHRIRFFSVENGAAREVYPITLKDWWVQNGDWSADSRAVQIQSLTPEGIPVILEANMTGKASVVLKGTANTTFWAMLPSPDGRHGILDVEVPGDNNAWMADKF